MRQKLIETFNKDWNEKAGIIELSLTESMKLVEADGQSYKTLGAYLVPIWKLNKKNLNGRVYSEALAKKVIKEGKTTFALDGHPEDNYEPVYEDVKAIGKEPQIVKDILYAKCYFVDEDFYKKAKRIIETGAGVGLSSSSWGDVDDKGNVLLEEFEIERYFDFVLNPSYEVFLQKEAEIKESFTNIVDKKKENNLIVSENKEMESMSTILEERNLKLGVKNLFEKAEKQISLKDKLSAYREIVEYCEGLDFATDYQNKAVQEVSKIESQIQEMADKGQKLVEDKVEESFAELKEKYQKAEENISDLEKKLSIATTAMDKLKEREINLKEMYDIAVSEKNGNVEAGEYKELHSYCEQLQDEIEIMKKENLLLKKSMKYMQESKKKENTMIGSRPAGRKFLKRNIAEDDVVINIHTDGGEVEIEEPLDSPEIAMNPYTDDFEYNSQIEPEFMNTDEVESYIEDLELENPNVKKIKERLLKCKTVFEAQKVYLNLKDLIEGSHKSQLPSRGYNDPSISKIKRKGWK